MVSAGMDFEKPRPLQVLVGVRTSVTTGFFNIAAWIQTFSDTPTEITRGYISCKHLKSSLYFYVITWILSMLPLNRFKVWYVTSSEKNINLFKHLSSLNIGFYCILYTHIEPCWRRCKPTFLDKSFVCLSNYGSKKAKKNQWCLRVRMNKGNVYQGTHNYCDLQIMWQCSRKAHPGTTN